MKELIQPSIIAKDQFFLKLIGARDYWAFALQKAQEDALIAQKGLLQVQRIAQEVSEAEALGLRVTYLIDQNGNLYSEICEKGKMGFIDGKQGTVPRKQK